jgi:hypothetical protein
LLALADRLHADGTDKELRSLELEEALARVWPSLVSLPDGSLAQGASMTRKTSA